MNGHIKGTDAMRAASSHCHFFLSFFSLSFVHFGQADYTADFRLHLVSLYLRAARTRTRPTRSIVSLFTSLIDRSTF